MFVHRGTKAQKEKSVNKAILKFNLRVCFLLCCLFSPGDRFLS